MPDVIAVIIEKKRKEKKENRGKNVYLNIFDQISIIISDNHKYDIVIFMYIISFSVKRFFLCS